MNWPYWKGLIVAVAERLVGDGQRGDVGVDFLERQAVEPGGSGPFAEADEEDGDARRAVAGRRSEVDRFLDPVARARMVLARGHDALPARPLDLERAAGGRILRVEILGADPAGEAIPAAGPELDFLSQGGVGGGVGDDPQRLASLVPDGLVQGDFRLGTVDMEAPALKGLVGLEAGVGQRNAPSTVRACPCPPRADRGSIGDDRKTELPRAHRTFEAAWIGPDARLTFRVSTFIVRRG